MTVSSPGRRVLSYDIARSFAIAMVVLCHCVEACYPITMEAFQNYSPFDFLFRIAAHTASRFGVPIFLFLTGALVLNKKIDSAEDILTFYKQNLLPLVFATWFWIAASDLFVAMLGTVPARSWLEYATEFLFLQNGTAMNHLWYMPMIIGLYVTIPLAAYLVNRLPVVCFALPAGLAIVYHALFPTVFLFLALKGIYLSGNVLDLSGTGTLYGSMVYLGYWMRKGGLRKLSSAVCLLLSLLAFGITIGMQYLFIGKGFPYTVWYNNIFLIAASVFFFEWLTRMHGPRSAALQKLFTCISKASLAIYFLHNFCLMLLLPVFEEILPGRAVRALVLWGLVLLTTAAATAALSRISFLRRRILLMKQRA